MSQPARAYIATINRSGEVRKRSMTPYDPRTFGWDLADSLHPEDEVVICSGDRDMVDRLVASVVPVPRLGPPVVRPDDV